MKVWKKFVVLALCLLSVTFTKASSTANAKSKFLEEYQRTMSSRIKERNYHFKMNCISRFI